MNNDQVMTITSGINKILNQDNLPALTMLRLRRILNFLSSEHQNINKTLQEIDGVGKKDATNEEKKKINTEIEKILLEDSGLKKEDMPELKEEDLENIKVDVKTGDIVGVTVMLLDDFGKIK